MTDAASQVEQQRAADADLVSALSRSYPVGELDRQLERGGEPSAGLRSPELTGAKT